MEEWIKYYDEAVSYSKVSQGAVQKGKLGNIVIYNMVSMSVEGFLTSILVNRGVYPHHSSIPSMFREVKKLMPIPDEFTPEIRFLNSFMNLCSLDVQAERIPTDEEIKRMSAFIAALHTWAEDSLITISKAC